MRGAIASRARLASALVVAVAAVLLGFLALAPEGASAQATGDIAASRVFPVFGPRLSGEEVLWTVPRRDRGYVIKRGSPSSGERRVVLTTESDRGRSASLFWVASPQELLVQQALATIDPPPEGGNVSDLGTARVLPDGELEHLSPGLVENSGNFDLDGSVGVFPGDKLRSAVVRDFSRPSSPPVRIDDAGLGLAVAGRYVAWFDAGQIVVYDYVARAELYRVTPPTGGAFDLQVDGKVAFTHRVMVGRQVKRKLGWASPAEPFPHELPLAPSPVYGLTLVNDVVVFERSEGSLAASARGELGSVALSGGEEKVLARSVETNSGGPDDLFDFDGERVAWLDRTCAGARVRVATLDDLVADPRSAPRRHCRLRLAGRPRLTRQGDLRFRVRCVGFRRDCRVFGATLRLARSYRVDGRRLRRGTRLFAKRRRIGGLSAVGRLKVSPQTRRLLRRRGAVRLVLRVRMGDPESTPVRRAVVAVR